MEKSTPKSHLLPSNLKFKVIRFIFSKTNLSPQFICLATFLWTLYHYSSYPLAPQWGHWSYIAEILLNFRTWNFLQSQISIYFLISKSLIFFSLRVSETQDTYFYTFITQCFLFFQMSISFTPRIHSYN